MTTTLQFVAAPANRSDQKVREMSASACTVAVALLTGGIDRRAEIKAFAGMRNSWGLVGDMTGEIYAQLLAQNR
jgi:hypothetical protein